MQKVDLWNTSLFVAQVNDESLNTMLKNEIVSLSESQPSINKSNIGSWHSEYGLNKSENKEIQRIHSIVASQIKAVYLQGVNEEKLDDYVLLCESWANINVRATFQNIHTHSGWAMSAVYYVKVPEVEDKAQDGTIQFHNFSASQVNPNFDLLSSLLGNETRRISPKTGMLIIFPSHMPHSVLPSFSDDERITIAFNFRYRKK